MSRSGGSFRVISSRVKSVYEKHIELSVSLDIRDKVSSRLVRLNFPREVSDETDLKRVFIEMAHEQGHVLETGRLARLQFGMSFLSIDLVSYLFLHRFRNSKYYQHMRC